MAITVDDLNNLKKSIDEWTQHFEGLPRNLSKSPKHQSLPIGEVELMVTHNMDVLRNLVNNWINDMSKKADD